MLELVFLLNILTLFGLGCLIKELALIKKELLEMTNLTDCMAGNHDFESDNGYEKLDECSVCGKERF